VTITQLAHDEPLSPELVLVFPPELRAQAVAALGPPVWPQPRPPLRLAVVPLEPVPVEPEERFGRALGHLLAARMVQLGVIFAAATVITLALSLVANALRTP
jgi:hypothetical protein